MAHNMHTTKEVCNSEEWKEEKADPPGWSIDSQLQPNILRHVGIQLPLSLHSMANHLTRDGGISNPAHLNVTRLP